MRASIGANDNTRAVEPVSLPVLIIVNAMLAALCWWVVLAIVGLLLWLL